MRKGTGKGHLQSLRKRGDVVYHKRSTAVGKDGRMPAFRLKRGIRLERAVKSKR